MQGNATNARKSNYFSCLSKAIFFVLKFAKENYCIVHQLNLQKSCYLSARNTSTPSRAPISMITGKALKKKEMIFQINCALLNIFIIN